MGKTHSIELRERVVAFIQGRDQAAKHVIGEGIQLFGAVHGQRGDAFPDREIKKIRQCISPFGIHL